MAAPPRSPTTRCIWRSLPPTPTCSTRPAVGVSVEASVRPVLVMGVCGSGKSTIGAAMAMNLNATFLEGDEFHPPANVARMAAGIALNDGDRHGWLQTLGARLGAAKRERRAVVL